MKKNRKKQTSKTLKSAYGYFLRTAWKEEKIYFFVRAFKLLLSAMEPFIAILYIPKIIAELMSTKNGDKLFQYAATMVILNFVIWVLLGMLNSIIDYYAQKFENHYKMILSKRIMELDFMKTEDKKALDQLELAKNGMSWYSGGMNGLMDPFFDTISNVLTLVGVILIIVQKAPMVFVITFVILIATTMINAKLNRIEEEEYAKLSKINRIFGYLAWELADFRYGADVRLYNAKDMLVQKYATYTASSNERSRALANKQLPLQLLSMLSDVVRDFGTYFYLGFLAIMGKITIATTSQMITSAGTFSNAIGGIIWNCQTMVKRANYANEFVKFLDYPMAMHTGTKNIPNGKHTFEFSHVSFAYPGTDRNVLEDLNLTLTEGEHLSVVGLNGAGKTTMVKLLCRLYDPTGGEILMDGVNIKEFNYDQYMAIFSPVFQDFKLFSFPISENLLFREGRTKEQEMTIIETLKHVGVYDKVQDFPNGIDTVLYKYFDEEGIAPSGGEQQKLAIARALLKNSPVVILDEPTAALDPIAEFDIYSQFQELVKGKSAIFISHRLASCQFCDKIAVFSEGHVMEYGTHTELMNIKDGIYAEMFRAQAQYYQRGEVS